MKTFISAILLAVLLPTTAMAGDLRVESALGGVLGGVVGGSVGSELGGRDGAIVGAVIGAAVGAAITTHDDHDRKRDHRPIKRKVIVERHYYPATRYDHRSYSLRTQPYNRWKRQYRDKHRWDRNHWNRDHGDSDRRGRGYPDHDRRRSDDRYRHH